MILQLHLSSVRPPSPEPPKNPNPKSPSLPLRILSPTLISSSSSPGLRFREKLLYLEHDLRLDSFKAIEQNPSLRSFPLSSILSTTDFFRSFGIQPLDAGRIFAMYPHLLTSNPELDLLPIFQFLLGPVSIPFRELRKSVTRCPRLLVSSVPHQLQPALYFLRRLGFVGSHKINSQTTLLLVSSVEGTLIPKLDYLQSLGLSYRETVKMVLRSPGLLTFSIENNFKPKVEFLVGEMGREVKDVKEFPQYFSFSLEGRIKPRYRMLVENGFGMMPLSEMLKVSEGVFGDRLLEMRLRSVDGEL